MAELDTAQTDEAPVMMTADAARKMLDEALAVQRGETVQKVADAIKAGAERTATDPAIDVTGTSVEDLKRQARPDAGQAARTQPAEFADWRYQCMPKWERELRSPEKDMEVGEYFQALNTAMRTNDNSAMVRIQGRLEKQRASLLEGDSTAGGPFDGTAGQLLPLPLSTYLQVALYRSSRFLALTRRFQATTGASLRIPFQTQLSTSLWEGEADPFAQGEGEITGRLDLQLQKLGTLAFLSNELISDSAFNVVQWLFSDVTPQMAAKKDRALYSTGLGSGSNQPRGFELNDVIITATTSNTNIFPTGDAQIANHFLTTLIDEDSISDLFYSLSEPERAEGAWAGPDTVMAILSKIKDGSGRKVFQDQTAPSGIIGDAIAGGSQGTMHNRPVFNLPGVEGTANSNENRLYFFNPMRTYATLDKGGIDISASEDVEFKTDQTVYRFKDRIDGGVIGNKIPGNFQYRFIGGISGVGTPV